MVRGLYIIGTDTGVGKTLVAAGLMRLLLGRGLRAAYFKPVASGVTCINGACLPADAAFVRAVSGFNEDFDRISPFSYEDEVAPHLAARLSGRPIRIDKIRQSLAWLQERYDIIIAEGAGGLMVPLSDEGRMQYDLIRQLGFSCLLVARAGLGTINHTLLTLRVARSEGLTVKGLVISGAGETPVEKDNIAMLARLSGIEAIFVLPKIDPDDRQGLSQAFESTFDISGIEKLLAAIGS